MVREERLAHIRTIVVSLGGKLTYVFNYATTDLLRRRYAMILGMLVFFLVYEIIWLFVALIELLGLRLPSLLFLKIWLFVSSL